MIKDYKTSLFAIYRDGLHLGNVRAIDGKSAIKVYLLGSGYSRSDFIDVGLINRYKVILAIKNVHHM